MERTQSTIDVIPVSSKQPINKTNFLNVYFEAVCRKMRMKNSDQATSKLDLYRKFVPL